MANYLWLYGFVSEDCKSHFLPKICAIWQGQCSSPSLISRAATKKLTAEGWGRLAPWRGEVPSDQPRSRGPFSTSRSRERTLGTRLPPDSTEIDIRFGSRFRFGSRLPYVSPENGVLLAFFTPFKWNTNNSFPTILIFPDFTIRIVNCQSAF